MDFPVIKRTQIRYEDDLVVVYDSNGEVIYKGIEDYEDYKRYDWEWNEGLQAYVLTVEGGDTYYKICLDVGE